MLDELMGENYGQYCREPCKLNAVIWLFPSEFGSSFTLSFDYFHLSSVHLSRCHFRKARTRTEYRRAGHPREVLPNSA